MMTQNKTLNVKLSNSQFNKINSHLKHGSEITLNLSSTVVGNLMIQKLYTQKIEESAFMKVCDSKKNKIYERGNS